MTRLARKHWWLVGLAASLCGVTDCAGPTAARDARSSPAPAATEPSTTLVPPSRDAGTAVSEPRSSPTDAGTSDAAAPSCEQPAAPSLEACRELLAAPKATCDSGFRPAHARFVHCRSGDLVCAIRQPGWDHAPIYDAAPPEQAASCLKECERGNGASCIRVAKALRSTASDASREKLRQACSGHLARQACQLGLPYACQDDPPCPDLPSRGEAFKKLRAACNEQEASWECFYVAHSLEMMWGTGPTKDRKAAYRRVCRAPCPPPPRRCYKTMACRVANLAP